MSVGVYACLRACFCVCACVCAHMCMFMCVLYVPVSECVREHFCIYEKEIQ